MPPKAKFSKEEIISKSLELVRENGFKNLTARNLAEKLNSSPRPIFTVFSSMEEVEDETLLAIKKLYETYVKEGLKKEIPFKGTGEAYILFAIREPKLFQILFMRESLNPLNIEHILPTIDKDYQAEISLIQNEYLISEASAKELYLHLWIYCHGLGALAATKVCEFSSEDISKLLTDVFLGLMGKIKEKESKKD